MVYYIHEAMICTRVTLIRRFEIMKIRKTVAVICLISFLTISVGCSNVSQPAVVSPYSAAKWDSTLTTDVMDQISTHYQETFKPEGNYAVFDIDNEETETSFKTSLRYQMSDEEVKTRMDSGQMVAANILVFDVYVDKVTGTVTDDSGGKWQLK